ncbi:MAG: serine hydrolase [Clostridium sp.]|uniref:serine hydrolase n=1 Tax=Clostridium sp. TaxID=1506 RepID=UPI003F38C925
MRRKLSAALLGALLVPFTFVGCGAEKFIPKEKEEVKNREEVKIDLVQVDTNYFPEIKLYFTVEDSKENKILENLTLNDFTINEKINGELVERKIDEIKFLNDDENISINMIMDTSSSMQNNMGECKTAAMDFLNNLNFNKGDKVSIIEFNDIARVNNYFTSDKESLLNSIRGLDTYGQTALYDALIDGLNQTNMQDGLKCIIAFTDGEDTSSKSSESDVIKLSKEYGIPIYIIGAQGNYNTVALENITKETNGEYINIDRIEELNKVYEKVLNKSKKQYMLKYKTDSTEVSAKDVILKAKSDEFIGEKEDTFEVKKKEHRLDINKYNELKKTVDNEIVAESKNLKGNYSIAFKDLNHSDVVIKNNKKTVAASVIKIYIMIEAYYQIHRNNLSLTDKLVYTQSDKVGGSGTIANGPVGKSFSIEELLKAMMTTSDNVAANMLIDHLGIDNINKRIKAMGCIDTELNRKMMDSNAINSGVENYTSVADLALTLSKIYNGQAVSKEVDKRMLALMERNTVKKKIPNKLPKGVKVMHKSGEYTNVENDAGIVITDKGAYVICVTTDKGSKENQENFISNISKRVYDKYMEYKK